MVNKKINLKIYGRVQGVFFRSSAQSKAKKLNLVGYVKNKDDGSVEIVAEGKQENLKEFLKWCYNGPIMAKVEKIDKSWQKANFEFEKFQIKY